MKEVGIVQCTYSMYGILSVFNPPPPHPQAPSLSAQNMDQPYTLDTLVLKKTTQSSPFNLFIPPSSYAGPLKGARRKRKNSNEHLEDNN
jgi:hypothetical protein